MEKIMTKEHKDTLLRYRDEIVENIRMDVIMKDLELSKTLSRRDVQEIKAKIGDQQAECFLDILYKRPDSAYETFITLLRNTNQEHVANLLETSHESNVAGNISFFFSMAF